MLITLCTCSKSKEIKDLITKLKTAESRAEAVERRAQDGAVESESRLHSIEASYKSQLMQATLDADAKISELKAQIEAASSREALLESECKKMVNKVQSMESDMSRAEDEVAEWQRRCNDYVSSIARITEERDEARSLASSKSKEASQLSMENARSKEVALKIQADLQGQDKMRKELQQRLDEMIIEAQSMRHQAMVSGSPLSRKTRPSEDSGAVTDQQRTGEQEVEGSFKRMTIGEIKQHLTSAGLEEKVWELSSRKPAAKKEDWIKLAMAV